MFHDSYVTAIVNASGRLPIGLCQARTSIRGVSPPFPDRSRCAYPNDRSKSSATHHDGQKVVAAHRCR